MQMPLYLGWQLDPVLIGSLLAVTVAYFAAIGPLRQRIAPRTKFPVARALLFSFAIVLTYLIEGSPLHDLAERYLFSAHMVQHLAISYFCAPLFIWAMPDWVLRPLLLNRRIKPIAKFFSNAVVAALTYTLFLSIWHFPAIYDAGLRNSSLHHTQHILFMIVALISWWPVMSPLPELPRLGYGMQIIYLFVVSTVLQIPLFGIITFANEPFYQTYINAPRVLFDTALDDQWMAGILMKVMAMILYAIPIIIIFNRWYNESQKQTFAAKPNAEGKRLEVRGY
ncbi:MAG: cytochrome c oxidase assembly protein [Trueperaceae bacterium]|nr:cytochrome c oxidase assembly protein [Trueperaceae bacterium]